MVARDRFAEPSEDDAQLISRGLDLVQAFRAVEPAMPTSYMAAFLIVALKPGLGVARYADELGMIRPIASRILLEIGKKTRTGGPGLGLVDSVQSSEDLRYFNYFLTADGRRLLAKVLAILGGNRK